ncbi:MAG: (2Fe-2S)-binding protein [Deltaproteobacteria bacterium]|nr:(2Fe-2S)-binding protein [Deltaproteobacteria bacterium]
MAKIQFDGQVIECEAGQVVRKVLLKAGLNPHNGRARWFNCKGMGTCGTCAVEIDGPVSAPTRRERARLQFAPHRLESGLRLACQCRVQGDLSIVKHPGFWGQNKP